MPPAPIYPALIGLEGVAPQRVHDRLAGAFMPTPEETAAVSTRKSWTDTWTSLATVDVGRHSGYRRRTRPPEGADMGRRALDFTVRRRGSRFADFTAEADPRDPHELRRLLDDAIRRDGWDASRIGEFEMEVRYAGDGRVLTTFVATDR
jgi:hypothetical protein